MIQAGYPPKMLQEIRGHASITTTLDLYGHLYPGDMDRYADRLDRASRGRRMTRRVYQRASAHS
jgi:integrase